MKTVALAPLLTDLERLAGESPGAVVAFDCDGTLWSGDVGDDMVDAFVARRALRPEAERRLREDAKAAGLDVSGSASDVLARVARAAHAGAYDEAAFYAMAAWMFAGCSTTEAREIADEVLEGLALPSRLHPEAVRAFTRAKELGLGPVVVSASPRVVIEASLAQLGLEARAIAATTPRVEAGRLVADVEQPMPYGDGKVAALDAMVPGATLLAAFGDNVFDVAMLARAARPVAVRPKERLRARAADVPALVELEAFPAEAETPDDVLTFWFGEGFRTKATFRDAWFVKSPFFDAEVRRVLLPLHERAARGELSAWTEHPESALAVVLLLDQVPRNVFRNDPRTFATDAAALRLAERMVDAGLDAKLPGILRTFVYLPFEHAEDLAAQDRSVALYEQLAADDPSAGKVTLDYAKRHRDVVARFGRFPHRNAVLGRASTPDEQTYLAQPGAGF